MTSLDLLQLRDVRVMVVEKAGKKLNSCLRIWLENDSDRIGNLEEEWLLGAVAQW